MPTHMVRSSLRRMALLLVSALLLLCGTVRADAPAQAHTSRKSDAAVWLDEGVEARATLNDWEDARTFCFYDNATLRIRLDPLNRCVLSLCLSVALVHVCIHVLVLAALGSQTNCRVDPFVCACMHRSRLVLSTQLARCSRTSCARSVSRRKRTRSTTFSSTRSRSCRCALASALLSAALVDRSSGVCSRQRQCGNGEDE